MQKNFRINLPIDFPVKLICREWKLLLKLLWARRIDVPAQDASSDIEQMEAIGPDFAKYYQQEILPLKATYEPIRIQALSKVILRLRVYLILFLVAILAACGPMQSLRFSLATIVLVLLYKHIWARVIYIVYVLKACTGIFGFGILFALLLIVPFYPAYSYSVAVRDNIYNKIIKFFAGLDYTTNSKSELKVLENNHLKCNFDYIICDIAINGIYKGVNIQIAEGMACANKTNTQDLPMIFALFDFKKHFSGVTIIKDKRLFLIQDEFISNGTSNVELESTEFNHKFSVSSTDQVEGRYILTPSLMEKIMGFAQRNAVKYYFSNGYLLIYILNYKNDDSIKLFPTPSVLHECCNLNEMRDFFQNIQHLLSIIDVLKLNR